MDLDADAFSKNVHVVQVIQIFIIDIYIIYIKPLSAIQIHRNFVPGQNYAIIVVK